MLFPDPDVRAGRHRSDRLPHSRDTGKGHECIPFVTASSAVVQIQVLTVLCIFLSLSPPFSHLSLLLLLMLFSFPLAICFFTPLHLGLCVTVFYLPHSLHLFFPLSLTPALPSSLHRPLPLIPSSNSCRPSTFLSMLPRGCPWPLTPPACLTRDWLWEAALGCWPCPGPLGPSWPLKTNEPIWRPWRQPPQPSTTEV